MIKVENYAVFDIETVGAYPSLDLAPAKMQDLWSKRCKFFRDRYPSDASLTDAELWEQRAGLHAEFAKVACVSFGIIKNGEIIIKSSVGQSETAVLEWTRNTVNSVDKLGLYLAGHTIERFDIPFLFKRFLVNGMRPPSLINVWNKKPWDLTFFDLAKFWSNGTWQESFVSLDTMSMVFEQESPKATTQASDVRQLYWSGNFDAIQEYCEGDVRATINVMRQISEVKELVA